MGKMIEQIWVRKTSDLLGAIELDEQFWT